MKNKELIEYLSSHIEIMLNELRLKDNTNKSNKGYIKHCFLETLGSLIEKKLEQRDYQDISECLISALDLANTMRPNNYSSQPDANGYLKQTIQPVFEKDLELVNQNIQSSLRKKGYREQLSLQIKQIDSQNHWGFKFIPLSNKFENKTKTSSNSSLDQDSNIESMVHYKEHPHGKLTWPRNATLTPAFSLFLSSICYFLSACVVFIIFALIIQKNASLLEIIPFLLFLYIIFSPAMTLTLADKNRRFPAPAYLRRKGSKWPIIVVTKRKSDNKKEFVNLEIKNIIGICPLCSKHGIGGQKVFLKPKSIFQSYDVIGICERSNEHKFSFDLDSLKGERIH
jgi:hypothetical protein